MSTLSDLQKKLHEYEQAAAAIRVTLGLFEPKAARVNGFTTGHAVLDQALAQEAARVTPRLEITAQGRRMVPPLPPDAATLSGRAQQQQRVHILLTALSGAPKTDEEIWRALGRPKTRHFKTALNGYIKSGYAMKGVQGVRLSAKGIAKLTALTAQWGPATGAYQAAAASARKAKSRTHPSRTDQKGARERSAALLAVFDRPGVILPLADMLAAAGLPPDHKVSAITPLVRHGYLVRLKSGAYRRTEKVFSPVKVERRPERLPFVEASA